MFVGVCVRNREKEKEKEKERERENRRKRKKKKGARKSKAWHKPVEQDRSSYLGLLMVSAVSPSILL